MHEEDTQFEQEVRRGLKDLADGAPGGAGAEGVRRRLRRRAIRRSLDGAAGVVGLVLLTVWLVPLQRGPMPQPTPIGPRAVPAPSMMQAQLPEPISAEASRRIIEAALRQCLAGAGVTGDAWVAKDPQRGLSLAVSGDAALPPETLQAQLARLLENFGTFEIALRNGQLQYRLFASREAKERSLVQG
jgi:hypothetical protein